MRIIYRFVLFILIILRILLSSSPILQIPETAKKESGVSDELSLTLTFIRDNLPESSADFVGEEWQIIALRRGGYEDSELYDAYISAVTDYVTSVLPAKQPPFTSLNRFKSTENARFIIALTALDADPTDVGGFDLTEALLDTEWVCSGTLNGPIYSLIALDISDVGSGERDVLVDYILGKQLDDGGWALSGTVSDPDVTAMALQALAAHRDREDVELAGEKAFDRLSSLQLENGGFRSWGTENSESISQVIIACASWGIDPNNDERFVKNDSSAWSALMCYRTTEGGFIDVSSSENRIGAGKINIMATEQAAIAIAAYDRFLSGHASVYGNVPEGIHK